MKRRNLTVIILAFAAVLLGVFAGRALAPIAPEMGLDIHSVLHERLKLDAGQERRLKALERYFSVQRQAPEAEMRADNRRLAQAIQA